MKYHIEDHYRERCDVLAGWAVTATLLLVLILL
jgi:hypothetical protein